MKQVRIFGDSAAKAMLTDKIGPPERFGYLPKAFTCKPETFSLDVYRPDTPSPIPQAANIAIKNAIAAAKPDTHYVIAFGQMLLDVWLHRLIYVLEWSPHKAEEFLSQAAELLVDDVGALIPKTAPVAIKTVNPTCINLPRISDTALNHGKRFDMAQERPICGSLDLGGLEGEEKQTRKAEIHAMRDRRDAYLIEEDTQNAYIRHFNAALTAAAHKAGFPVIDIYDALCRPGTTRLDPDYSPMGPFREIVDTVTARQLHLDALVAAFGWDDVRAAS